MYGDLKKLYKDYCKLYNNPLSYEGFHYALNNRDSLERKEKHKSVKEKKEKYNMEKRWYFLRVNRGMLGRYIDEKQVFNEEDINYLRSIPDYN